MQQVLQVKRVETGAQCLKHAATDFSGKISVLNKAALSPRWFMREIWVDGWEKTGHRVSDMQGLDFLTYSFSIWRHSVSIPFRDYWYHWTCKQTKEEKRKKNESFLIVLYYLNIFCSEISLINQVRTEELRKLCPETCFVQHFACSWALWCQVDKLQILEVDLAGL